MIAGFLYRYIYLIFIVIMTIIFGRQRRNIFESEPIIFPLVICVSMALFLGNRPYTADFVDTLNYAQWWGLQFWNGFNLDEQNVLFDNLFVWMGSFCPNPTPFFCVIALIYFLSIMVACKKLFEANTTIVILVCMAALSTFSYGTNGIKAGAAASLFLVSLAYRDKLVISLLFLFISWGFHHSMHLAVGVYVITLFVKDSKWYFYGWLFCLAMAAGHVSFFQSLFASLSDDSGSAYLSSSSDSDWGGKSGFRYDFVLYSAMPVLMGYFVIFKYKLKDMLYESMLHYYLATNSIWMLCMYGTFTNRIAYLSWFCLPVLVVYPCFAIPSDEHPLVENKGKYIWAHLGFTLFMELVYYA